MNHDHDQKEYLTYNGMARNPLILGVPIIALVIALALILVTGFGGVVIFGWKGIFPPLFILALLFVIRVECSKDSKAIESLMWDIKGFFLRVLHRSKIISFGSVDNNPIKRKQNVRNWFKNNSARK